MNAPGSTPRDGRQRLGLAGEQAAEAVLIEAGMTILERRFRLKIGEIDLIAREGSLVVFVEVKTRRGRTHGTPAQAVTARKRERLARVAEAYLTGKRWTRCPCRFDVVQVFAGPRGIDRVDHIRDAFRIWKNG